MKLKFNNHSVQQPQISPIQAENRRGRPNVVPLFSSLLIALAIAVTAFLVYRWYTFGHISAYAVVSGKMMEIRSPCQGEVSGLTLRLGDPVASGSKVCMVVPTEFEKQLHLRNQTLKAWSATGQQTLEFWRTTGRAPGAPAATAVPSSLIEPTDAELTALAVKRAERLREDKKSIADRVKQSRQAEELAHLAVKRAEQVHEDKQAILERTRLLRQADAATEADVRVATAELEQADFGLAQAQVADHGLQATTEADLQSAKLELDLAELSLAQAKATDAGVRRKLGLPVAASPMSLASQEPPPPALLDLPPASIDMKSAMNGQVIEIAVADGEVVAPNQKILKVLESGTLWIDAYVSPEEAQRIEDGDEVRIHLAGDDGVVHGHVAACARIANPLPEVLARRVKGVDNVCRVRIDLDNAVARLDCGSVIRVVVNASRSGFGSFLKSLRR